MYPKWAANKSHFYRLIEGGDVCIICDSYGMCMTVELMIPANVSIFCVKGSLLNPWKKDVDARWNEAFGSYSFREYRLICDIDYCGIKTIAVSFLAIKKFHPTARIFECRILEGPGSRKIRKIVSNFYDHATEVGNDVVVDFRELLTSWDTAVEVPSTFKPSIIPSGSVHYLRHLKTIQTMLLSEIYNFSLEWGKRGDIKRLIFQELLNIIHTNNSLMDLKCLEVFVRRRWDINEEVDMRSYLGDTSFVNVIRELSSSCLPIIEEMENRTSGSHANEDYFFKINEELYNLIFRKGIDHPIIPLGAFSGCSPDYGGLGITCPPENANTIMRYLVFKSLGVPVRAVFKSNAPMYHIYTMDTSPQNINALIRIWNILVPNRRKPIQFQLEEDSNANPILNITCCEILFNYWPDLCRHLKTPHFV